MDYPLLRIEAISLFKRMEEAGMRYAVCGRLPLSIYGAPRNTKDIDLVIPRSELPKAKDVAIGAGYLFDSGCLPFPKQRFDVYRLKKIVGTEVLPLDLLMLEEDDQLLQEFRKVAIRDVRTSVLSLKGMIELKTAAGRAQDLADIEKLKELQHGEG